MSATRLSFGRALAPLVHRGVKTQTRREISQKTLMLGVEGRCSARVNLRTWNALRWETATVDSDRYSGEYLRIKSDGRPVVDGLIPHVLYPIYKAGDTLAMLEGFAGLWGWGSPAIWTDAQWSRAVFLADTAELPEGYRLISSRFLPTRQSRLTLTLTRVRLEKLHQISDADCAAEGIARIDLDGRPAYGLVGLDGRPGGTDYGWPPSAWKDTPQHAFAVLWDKYHGPNQWARNPWVFVLEFSANG